MHFRYVCVHSGYVHSLGVCVLQIVNSRCVHSRCAYSRCVHSRCVHTQVYVFTPGVCVHSRYVCTPGVCMLQVCVHSRCVSTLGMCLLQVCVYSRCVYTHPPGTCVILPKTSANCARGANKRHHKVLGYPQGCSTPTTTPYSPSEQMCIFLVCAHGTCSMGRAWASVMHFLGMFPMYTFFRHMCALGMCMLHMYMTSTFFVHHECMHVPVMSMHQVYVLR